MKLLYRVEINEVIKLECLGEESLHLKKNDWCIVKFDRHDDLGQIYHIAEDPGETEAKKRKLPSIKRRATLVDQGKAHENNVRSKSFHRIGLEKIEAYKLPMTLVATHFTYDRSLIIFLFTAPGRVDFRELVKDLNKTLHIRVELRQIGPRDQAAITGGMGSCGRSLCCSGFLVSFVSINVKMAKDQGLSLNPSSMIGACGRLKCCLQYEHDGYRELSDSLPKIGSRCNCQGCPAKVLETFPLEQTVRLSLNNGDRIVTVRVDELEPPDKD